MPGYVNRTIEELNNLKIFKMTQINCNQTATLQDIKDVFEASKIEGDKLIVNPEHFRSFNWLLTAVVNPFSNSSKEAQDFIVSFCKENGIKEAVFSHIPEWAQ